MDKTPLVSIIIRTKNEEQWIDKCLRRVYKQDYPHFEVILVDNCSTDNTINIAKKYECKIIKIKHFNYSKALNKGIMNSKGKYIVCLSGHCIPKSKNWLWLLARHFINPKLNVAGVYGRQEPLPNSSDFDKRDLYLLFGLDPKIQVKDPFFSNANSIIRRDLWLRFPFDEALEGQEDRAWAKNVLGQNYTIIYDPKASVYHYHGMQGQDKDRCERNVKIIEMLDK